MIEAPDISARKLPGHDELAAILPADYFAPLTGEIVPVSGGKVNCPNPNHTDTRRSCKVYGTAAEGWSCCACGKGGTIFDLAGLIFGLPTRGSGFLKLHRTLHEVFLDGSRRDRAA